MSAYIHGSLAVEERAVPKTKVHHQKKAVQRKRSMPTQEKLLYLFTIIICVIVAGAIISRYAQIYEVNTKMQMIERQITALENENKVLKIEVNKLQDPKRLFEMGKSIGLVPAGEEEIDNITQEIATNADQLKVAYNH